MKTKKLVAYTLPPNVIARLNETAEHFGLSRSETLRRLMEHRLGMPAADEQTPQTTDTNGDAAR